VRRQTPRPPFPYREEQVAFDGAPGVRLAGALTLPGGAAPFPAVVMITGSGPQDRDETLFDHKPFAVIADALTRKGVAVLRYDDRGVGQSVGPTAGATSEDFAGDVRAAVAFLRGREDIDPDRIGLIGHSEGASIAPMVAVADPRIAFIVLMAAPGVPGPEAMAAQRQAIAKVRGADPETIAGNEALMRRFDAAMAQAPDLASAQAQAAKIAEEAPSPQARAQLRAFASPWYRWFMRHDPAPVLRQVKAPVLALDGANDLQVPPDPNLIAVRAALSGNPKAEVVELPGLNHLFQTSATGDPQDYARIEETLAPVALDRIVQWVATHAKAGAGSLR
jgi:pimeloyl-ACP methyl ester carboxylesterase